MDRGFHTAGRRQPGGAGLTEARAALGRRDFRLLLAARMASQLADGAFLAAVLQTVVFLPERQDTVRGFALATALLLLPFSLLGPFTGVFVDRWRRRQILTGIPLLRAGAALLTLPGAAAVVLAYTGALVVFSANRLYQATASAVLPSVLGPGRSGLGPDAPAVPPGACPLLFTANAVIAVGGSVTLFGGMVTGGQLAVAAGVPVVLALACGAWAAAALLSARLSHGLTAATAPAAALVRASSVVLSELDDGFRRIAATPAAFVPILAVAANQMLQVMVIVVSMVAVKEGIGGGLVSFSWLVGAGGAGVFLGFLTVGMLRARVRPRLLIGLAGVTSAASLLPAVATLGAATLTVGAVVIGLSYGWLRVPADTLAQRAVPDRYRGRVFTVMDLGFNTSRVAGALAAMLVVPPLGPRTTLVVLAASFLLLAPLTPLWLRGAPEC